MKSKLSFASLLSGGILLAISSVHAATYYWDTNGNSTTAAAATGTWGVNNYWSTSSTGNAATSAQTIDNTSDVVFSSDSDNTGGTVTVSGTQAAHSITFDDASGAITLSGGTAINLGSATAGSGIFFTNATGSANVISTDIILNSAATAIDITNNGTALQTIGAITGSATSGTQTLTVGASNSGGNLLNGAINDGVAGGMVALKIISLGSSNATVMGTGITTLTGTNGYTGTTTVNYSTLDLGGGGGTGSLASTALVLDGGTFNYTRNDSQTKNFSTTSIKGASSVSAAAGNTLGLGTITRSSKGTLTVGNTGAVTTSNLSNDATGIVGPWVFYGNQYAKVTSGTFGGYTGTSGEAETDWTTATTNYEITTRVATRTLTGSRTGNTFRYSGTGGNAAINLGTGTSTLTLNGLLAVGSGGTLTISRGTGGTGSVIAGSSNEIVIAGSQNVTISAPISSGAVTYSGTGTLVLSGDNTYAGGFTLNSGIMSLGGSSANYTGFGTGKVTWNGGQITTNNGAAVTIGNDFDLDRSTLSAQTGGGTLNFGGIITLKQNINFAVSSNTTDTRFVFNNTVGDGGNGYGLSIAPTGGTSGGITFNAVNTFTGDITIGQASTSAGRNRTLVIGNNGSLNSGNYAGNIANNNSGGSITYSSSANQILSGTISGSAALIKDTSTTSTLTLTGTNTYTGSTTVSAGTLAINGTGSINSSSGITVNAGGTFRYNSSVAMTKVPTLNGVDASNRATFGGTGNLGTLTLVLDNIGDVLSPGNSPGVQGYGTSQTWTSFTYEWELNDWSAAVAGTNIDLIAITGGLTLDGSSYGLDILSLVDINNVSGAVANFTESNNSWTILTTTTGITGFDANEWAINANGFANNETGSWSLAQSGNNLVLTYTAIPEPSAALLGGLGLLLLLRRRRAV